MFGEWLSEQTDRKGDVGKFARIVWEDYTSGCARWYGGALEWRDHISQKHPDRFDDMYPLLREAFAAYAADNNIYKA